MSTFYAIYENGEILRKEGADAIHAVFSLPGKYSVFQADSIDKGSYELGVNLFFINPDRKKDNLRIEHLQLIGMNKKFDFYEIKVFCDKSQLPFTFNTHEKNLYVALGKAISILNKAVKFRTFDAFIETAKTELENENLKKDVKKLSDEIKKLKDEIEKLKK